MGEYITKKTDDDKKESKWITKKDKKTKKSLSGLRKKIKKKLNGLLKRVKLIVQDRKEVGKINARIF